jgi:hypothetical protein
MDNQPLYPDAAQRIMSIVRSIFGPEGDVIHVYSLGVPDNLVIPTDAYPYVIVDKAAGTYSLKDAPTGTDSVTEHVYVHILLDAKVGFGAPPSDDTVKRQLQTLVEGRDPTTGYLLPTSLMYGLRTYITLQSQSVPGLATINNEISISYDAPQRPDMPETREAVIDITVTERQVVLNRR